MSGIHTEILPVRYYDLDQTGKISLEAIFYYLQEAATKHADKLDITSWKLKELNLIWVLYKMHVKMDDMPGFNNKITIETWPSLIRNPYAFRSFKLFDENKKPVGSALATWLLIDATSRKIASIPDFIKDIHELSIPMPIEPEKTRMKTLESIDYEKEFEVLYKDIDTNRHTNNVSYISWALETIPEDIRKKHIINEAIIEFKSETFYNQKLIAQTNQTEEEDKYIFSHQIINKEDNKPVSFARTVIGK